MVEGVKVINVMADGSICEDLRTYQIKGPIPEDALRLIYDFMKQGRKIREQQEREKNNEESHEISHRFGESGSAVKHALQQEPGSGETEPCISGNGQLVL